MTHEIAVMLKKKLDKQKERYEMKLQDVYSLLENLKEDCPHQEIENKSKYFEGGYLNTSYYEDYKVCKTCGKILQTDIKNTGSYV